MQNLNIWVLLLFCVISQPVSAEPLCKKKNVMVFYGNGMNTDFHSALDSINLIGSDLLNTHRFYNLAYNQNETGLTQLREVLLQWLHGIDVANGKGLLSYTKYKFRDYMRKYRQEILSDDRDLQRHVRKYRNFLKDDRYGIVLVAHSQGNFYANMSHDILSSELGDLSDKFRIVSVGTPDSRVAGGDSHITNKNDFVISNIPNSLPGNTLRVPSSPLTFNHGFVRDYYTLGQARTQINDLITYATDQIQGKDDETAGNVMETIKQRKCIGFMSSFNKTMWPEQCQTKCSTQMVDMSDFQCPSLCELYCCSNLDLSDREL